MKRAGMSAIGFLIVRPTGWRLFRFVPIGSIEFTCLAPQVEVVGSEDRGVANCTLTCHSIADPTGQPTSMHHLTAFEDRHTVNGAMQKRASRDPS